ncbi:hypothetical protein ACFFLM_03015 [Deinococcus oregonensis]|uniref:DUF2207 domain-containing protein n=1 Tax=Deinococcus oregonensis TaxID=1805970 RepID=A0ABV6ATY0_9DEIO
MGVDSAGNDLRVPQQVDMLEQQFKATLDPLLSAPGGQFHAAQLNDDTLVLDAVHARWRILQGVSPDAFEAVTPDGQRGTVLVVEGDGSRRHPYPPFTDLEWWVLEDWPEDSWTDLTQAVDRKPLFPPELRPDQHVFQPESPRDPPATRPASVGGWVVFLIAFSVLAVLTAFGTHALLWSLAGGWQLLWALPGVFFLAVGAFGLGRMLLSLQSMPASSSLVPALNHLNVDCADHLTIGRPFEVTVQASRLGESPLPSTVWARVMRYTAKDDHSRPLAYAEGSPEVQGLNVTYCLTVHSTRRHAVDLLGDAAPSLWALELTDGSETYYRVLLNAPPLLVPLRQLYWPDKPTQISALLSGGEHELILKAYNGEAASSGLARHGGALYDDDLTEAETRAVFTVSIHEVVTAAWKSGWIDTLLRTGSPEGNGALRLVLEENEYRVRDVERFWQQVLYASPDARKSLEAFLVRQSWAQWLDGTDGLLAKRTRPDLEDHPQAH